MPNGGSDCCGTCCFNEKNQDRAGFAHTDDPGRDYCTIRGLNVGDTPSGAFYTYCVNHPHHNPDRIDVPIGPVYVGVTDPPRSWVVGTRREPWAPAPDSTELRRKVIVLAVHLSVDPQPEHPFGASLRLGVIEQLAAWRDINALPALRRIAQAEAPSTPPELMGVARDSVRLIEAARAAITEIEASLPQHDR
jgi:hypothetical protein